MVGHSEHNHGLRLSGQTMTGQIKMWKPTLRCLDKAGAEPDTARFKNMSGQLPGLEPCQKRNYQMRYNRPSRKCKRRVLDNVYSSDDSPI